MLSLRGSRLLWLFVAFVALAFGVRALVPKKTSPPEAPSRPRIPSHFESADAGRPFPRTLSPSNFDDPVTVRAYAVAREFPEVLVQQPCYCWCKGHGSLLGCHTTRHADE
jgi:hypothetical protein